MNKLYMLALFTLLSSGCITFNDDVKYHFPDSIKASCKFALDDSKNKIQSKGTKLEEKKGCTVEIRAAEKKINGTWCWYIPEQKVYVGGLYYSASRKILIGANPKNLTDITMPVLIHEFAHHWLVTNFRDYTHNNKYDGLFYSWKGTRDITGKSFETSDGVHYDFIFLADDYEE